MIFTDSHIHTCFSGDSDTLPLMQLTRAEELGMKSICITDHNDHDVISDIDFNLDIPRYFKELLALKEEYKGSTELLVGIEQGLQCHITDYLNETADSFSFDFIIGSVHFVDGFDPYYPAYFEKYGSRAYELYFNTVYECITACKAFDSLGHLDYIVRYGQGRGLSFSYAEYGDLTDRILRVIIDSGKALEVNTGWLGKGGNSPNPCRETLSRYREMGGELITIGSDAHNEKGLGCAFSETGELLQSLGFRYYAYYRGRKPQMLPL